jgi:hypothetical protein
MELEKNDVDISKLFDWGRVFEVVNPEGEVEALVYMKLLGDADSNRARVYALRKSAELRKSLWDESNTERWIYLKSIYELEHEDLINYIVFFSMRDINNRALKEVSVPRPKQPKSNAPLAKLEKFQKELDSYPDQLGKALVEFKQKEVEKMKTFLQTEDKEVLYKKYVKALIDEFCEQEAMKAYRDYEVYLGCFKDDSYKVRFFASFEDYDNLDTQIKNDFRAAYDTISIGTDQLKKLREATR